MHDWCSRWTLLARQKITNYIHYAKFYIFLQNEIIIYLYDSLIYLLIVIRIQIPSFFFQQRTSFCSQYKFCSELEPKPQCLVFNSGFDNLVQSSFEEKKSVNLIPERCHICFRHNWPLPNWPSKMILL